MKAIYLGYLMVDFRGFGKFRKPKFKTLQV